MPGDDIIDDLARVRREIVDMARRLAPTEGPRTRFEGADASGMVRVSVDPSCAVHDVVIDPRWRRELPPEELVEAIQQAVRDAGTARLTAWAQSVATRRLDQSPMPNQMSHDIAMAQESAEMLGRTIGEMTDGTSERAAYELASLLERFKAAVNDIRHDIEQRLAEPHTARTQHVTAAVTGAKQLVSIEYHQRWLATASAADISRETSEALRTAYQEAAQSSADTPIGDPLALARQLGLWR